MVSSGLARDIELLIVDPLTHEVLPDGRVGEIWLRGPSVAVGYWNQPELTEETFHAVTADGREGFLRTGDKGVLDDGHLYVTGRIKEMLIHNGRNLYPQDIEGAVQQCGAPYRPGGGAVFGVPDTESDQTHVVVVQELRPTPGSEEELASLASQVQGVLSRKFQLPRANVVLTRPGAVHKTTSGKIQRTLMRRLFLAGELPVVHSRLDPRVEALLAAQAGEEAAADAAAGTPVTAQSLR
jgi:acyl-CoA synthetase (AMP-forming)/AMP-acid ligase II